ncbi:MAG: ROK family protein [Atopobiaceae bacterium]|nr:ROK family protein [Atopobiaceae bacterium]MBR1828479.1 ROK family protein [Atopobiaceae bacterium]
MQLSCHGKVPNTFSSQADFVEAIASLCEANRDEVTGIALSYCGELDPSTGMVFNGGSYGFNTGTNLKQAIVERCSVPVEIESDGNCAALAEVRRGNLRGHDDSVTLVLGTGVACSIVLGDKLWHGSHFFSGAVSFAATDLRADFGWGNVCAAACGANGLTGIYERLAGVERGSVGGFALFELVGKGDELAQRALDEFCGNVARLVANLQLVLDVPAFAIGGGVSAQPALREGILRAVERVWESQPMHVAHVPMPEVVFCALGNDSNLIGAACHFVESAADLIA